MARATESEMSRTIDSPLIPGARCTVAQALMQVCMHSQGHRSQCAKMLRRLGGTPPMTDFILWLANRSVPVRADDDPASISARCERHQHDADD